MLGGIDPVALPVWAVFLFALSLYPLGFLMPGCPCCGGGACTECGVLAWGYVAEQDGNGRMCCASGTVAASVTLRITNVGPATAEMVFLGSGASYQKDTRRFPCSDVAGDYVFPLLKRGSAQNVLCTWEQFFPLYWVLAPAINGAFPNWKLTANVQPQLPSTRRLQTCSMSGGVESCNIGSTSTTTATLCFWYQAPATSPGVWESGALDAASFAVENCTLSGVSFNVFPRVCNPGISWPTAQTEPPLSGCEWRVELV